MALGGAGADLVASTFNPQPPMRSLASLRLAVLLPSFAASIEAMTLTVAHVFQTEDFNSLATATGSALPAGWSLLETGSGANTTYGATNGSSSTGNTYSFGATSDAERSLGSVRTSSVASVFGVVLTNQTGATLTQVDLQYVGEQWRLGALGRTDRLDFAYSLDATSLATGTWLDLDALDLIAPVTSGVTGALDGNSAENQLLVSQSISGLNLAPGATLWLRWSDFDATGSDDGLAIDNFSARGVAATTSVSSVPDRLSFGWVVGTFVACVVATMRFRRSVEGTR